MIIMLMRRPRLRLLLLGCTSLLLSYRGVASGQDDCPAEGAELTDDDALGPFYLVNSTISGIIAARDLLVDPSNVFVVNGVVYGEDCVPLAGARVEAWYAGEEDDGVFYSDTNYRGQVFTNECGEFVFTQTFPALYPQRPIPHIHYRISSPVDDEELLVTQLYFEGLIPPQFDPDETKITNVTNEADGSRSAEFHVYVSMPGNVVNLEACEAAEEEEALPILGENVTMPIDGEGMLVDGEEDPVVCGPTICETGQVCCNESCGICTPPGGFCRNVGCLSVDLGPDDNLEETESPSLIQAEEGEVCGPTICPAGEVCCNNSCGICTPPDMECMLLGCPEFGGGGSLTPEILYSAAPTTTPQDAEEETPASVTRGASLFD